MVPGWRLLFYEKHKTQTKTPLRPAMGGVGAARTVYADKYKCIALCL